MIQTALATTMVKQYNISATMNNPGSPGVDLAPRKDSEPREDEKFLKYRAFVGSLLSRTHFAPAHAISITPVRAAGRRFCR